MAMDADLGRDVLRDVSRSFYLSLRFLPSGFREPMAVGYLLARLSDTIADAGTLPLEKREELLEALGREVERLGADAEGQSWEDFARGLQDQTRDAGLSEGERTLV